MNRVSFIGNPVRTQVGCSSPQRRQSGPQEMNSASFERREENDSSPVQGGQKPQFGIGGDCDCACMTMHSMTEERYSNSEAPLFPVFP